MIPPRAFHRLAWSNLCAQSAEQVGLAATPLLAVIALGADAGETGLLAMVQTLPFLLLSLPAGVLADRLPRRSLMAIAESLRALALLAVPIAAALGFLSFGLLALVGFLAATGTVMFSVAAPSLVPALVDRAGLAAANCRLELARSLAFAAGPALGGALVGWAGPSPAFGLAVGLSLLAAVLLARLPEPERPARAADRPLADLMEGARFALGHALLRPILVTAVVWNIAWFVLQAVYVPYAMLRLGLDAAAIGITLGAFGAGMVVGAMLAPRLARILSFGVAIVMGPLMSVAAALVMAASIRWPGITLPALAFFLFGAGPILWTIGTTTLRQAITPSAMLGRVSAILMVSNAGARPIGAAIGGLVGGAFGPEPCLVIAAAGFVLQAAMILVSPVPGLKALPEGVAAE